MQILSDSQFQYIPTNYEFDTCFVTRVFILIIYDTVNVLSTFKHLSPLADYLLFAIPDVGSNHVGVS